MSKKMILGFFVLIAINLNAETAKTAPIIPSKTPPIRYELTKDVLNLYKNLVSYADKVRVAENELKKLKELQRSHAVLSEAQEKLLKELPGQITDHEERLKLYTAELWHTRFEASDLVQLKERIRSDKDILATHDPEAETLISSLHINRGSKLLNNSSYMDIVEMLRKIEDHVSYGLSVHVQRDYYEELTGNAQAGHKNDVVDNDSN